MKLFQKRESLTQNIAFMALMSGITLVISVFATFFPILGVFIIIALPLTSTLVELYCKDRYYIIYAIGTIGLCLAANFWNIGTTFYYVIPSIFTGFIFGFMTKKSIPSVWTILVAATIQFGLTIGSIYIIRLMIGVDMLETFRTIFDFIDYDLFNIIFPTFCFLVSSIQVVLSYIVISNEIKKFGYEVDHDKTHMWIYQALTLVLCGSIIGFQFIYIPIAYVIVIMVYYLALYIVLDYINLKYWRTLILFGVGLAIMIIVFAFCYSLMPPLTGFLLFAAWPAWVSFVAIIVSCFTKAKPLSKS